MQTKNWIDEEDIGDTYQQMREAEREGNLCDLLFPMLDNMSEEDYQAFRRKWLDAWSSYKKEISIDEINSNSTRII